MPCGDFERNEHFEIQQAPRDGCGIRRERLELMSKTLAWGRCAGVKVLERRASARVFCLKFTPRAFLLMLASSSLLGCTNFPPGVDAIETPLTHVAGDPARGRNVFMSAEAGNCVLCHLAPDTPASGNIGPPIGGVGARLNRSQLRLRVVDITRFNPDAAMPAFHRVSGLVQVASRFRDQPVLTAQQVEDVVAYLGTLK